ncbi:chaperonin GroES [Candidatus Carsonella ruddii HT isolate Thao2000]|uniref:10 kDa chaperonin n=1 Tax=Candidatus Carsonella ruddii HT isolate Thao2000 TaxID=1202539 RepID=J3YQA5_CARRU|nr:molecular chaperone GroES [Candidatus Carsonella ruddii]AFP84098.1 chaperonin GroES [Candidatus Carsonella ruddii HT isolate Thao2000]
MEFFPLYDKIVVIKLEENNKIGGIYIPNNDNSILKGKVIKTGIGRISSDGKIHSLIVKENDLILFKNNFNIDNYKYNNIEYFFLKESEIISIIK